MGMKKAVRYSYGTSNYYMTSDPRKLLLETDPTLEGDARDHVPVTCTAPCLASKRRKFPLSVSWADTLEKGLDTAAQYQELCDGHRLRSSLEDKFGWAYLFLWLNNLLSRYVQ